MILRFVTVFPIYIFVLLWEMIKANVDVALRVINPALPIAPGFVKVKTDLRSDFLKFVLANSITLTPGTLTVDVVGDELLIHWIKAGYVKEADKVKEAICGRFERLLKRIEG